MTQPPVDKGAVNYSFPKKFILRGKKNISELFRSSSFFYLRPFKVIYTTDDNNPFLGFLITVPKSRFKKASDRNVIKRRIKEAIRLNKEILFDAPDDINLNLDKIAIIYTGNEFLSYSEIEDKLISVLNRLKSISKKENEKF